MLTPDNFRVVTVVTGDAQTIGVDGARAQGCWMCRFGSVCGVLPRQIVCTNLVLIGIGNVYRAELLFRHRLDPLQPGCELPEDQWSALWSDLVELMRDGVRRGRIDTVRPEHDPVRMGRAPRQDRHGGEVYVYRRAGAPCLICGADVATVRHAGRNLYWCPDCQRRPAL